LAEPRPCVSPVFGQVDEPVLVRVPLVPLGLERIGHFVGVEQAVAVLVVALKPAVEKAVHLLGVGRAAGASAALAHAGFDGLLELVAGDLAAGDAQPLREAVEHALLPALQVGPVDGVFAFGEHVEHLVGVAAAHHHATAAGRASTAAALEGDELRRLRQRGRGHERQGKRYGEAHSRLRADRLLHQS
jgi:hypothetical protein